jgi:hypothetical protein
MQLRVPVRAVRPLTVRRHPSAVAGGMVAFVIAYLPADLTCFRPVPIRWFTPEPVSDINECERSGRHVLSAACPPC